MKIKYYSHDIKRTKRYYISYWKFCDLITIIVKAKTPNNAIRNFRKIYGFYTIEKVEEICDE